VAVDKGVLYGSMGSDPFGNAIDLAIQSIDRILTPPSELLELWQESEDFEVWKHHMAELKQRLR